MGILGDVVLPLLARGVILRRPGVVGAIERHDLDRRAIRRLQAVHERHGPGPVRLELPGRTFAIPLEPADARRVLQGSPEPFAPATREKRAALETFQPHGVLTSHGPERRLRRAANEAALDADAPLHRAAGPIQSAVMEEGRLLAGEARRAGELTWSMLADAWHRTARRVVLGATARSDTALTTMLDDLRASANWSVLGRRRRRLRARFLGRLEQHVAAADDNSLVGRWAHGSMDPRVAPVEQVPQWLFAFDAAGWTLARALELITSDHAVLDRARRESIELEDTAPPAALPFLRSCVLDTLRLYPTTPAILREATEDTAWGTGTLPAGSGILLFAPYFHRDDRVVPQANRFAPERWRDHLGTAVMGETDEAGPFLPFSAGPAICPGRHVVLLTVSSMLATLLDELDLRPTAPGLDLQDLPSALSPFGTRMRVA